MVGIKVVDRALELTLVGVETEHDIISLVGKISHNLPLPFGPISTYECLYGNAMTSAPSVC